MFDLIYRFDPTHRFVSQPPADAEEARQRLEAGNREFASILGGGANAALSGSKVMYFDLDDAGIGAGGGAPRQTPFAVVLGCSDARVPTELIFNQACNELFVVRVAGTVLSQEVLGSFDYAVQHLGADLRLLVALGHSQCGAVTAAVDAYLRPVNYLEFASSHPLRSVVNSLFPAVCAGAAALSRFYGEGVARQPGYRSALIETAVTVNAALAAFMLRQEFAEACAKGLQVVFGIYDLVTRRVGVPLADPSGADRELHLIEPPRNAEESRVMGAQLVGREYIRQLLAGPGR
jgi:carbonic anhydrase